MTERRKYRTQEPPYNLALELVKGCSAACHFCAMQAIQERPGRGYKFMEKNTLISIMEQVKDLKWHCRVGFAMRGEPSEHPYLAEMVAVVRAYMPKTHMVMLSNGSGFMHKPGPVENITNVFNAGLSVLGLDDYQGLKWVEKIMNALSEHGRLHSGVRHKLGFTYYDYPRDPRGNPHLSVVELGNGETVRRRRGEHTLVKIRDISLESADEKRGNHNKLSNFAGLAFPPNDKMAGKRCHQPFRQMVVHWDGNVPICCGTWDSPYNCGNVLSEGVDACWQSNAMGAAREMLIRGRREFNPCKGCDSRSFRVGLLPNSKGKGRLHTPDEQTFSDIEAALAGGPRDKIVRVPWQGMNKLQNP